MSFDAWQEMLRFAERHARSTQAAPGVERRSEPRRSLVTPAILHPVDTALDVVGDPLAAVTRDISQSGIGLFVDALPRHRLFAVHFTLDAKDECLLVRSKWSEPVGAFAYIGFRALAVLEAPRTADSPGGAAALPDRFFQTLAT